MRRTDGMHGDARRTALDAVQRKSSDGMKQLIDLIADIVGISLCMGGAVTYRNPWLWAGVAFFAYAIVRGRDYD